MSVLRESVGRWGHVASGRGDWYNLDMTLQELEKTIADLPPEDLSRFREWFLAFDARNWDQQFEADVSAGRLDRLADEAIREHQAGESTSL